jgi:hypothetical protein
MVEALFQDLVGHIYLDITLLRRTEQVAVIWAMQNGYIDAVPATSSTAPTQRHSAYDESLHGRIPTAHL